MQYINSADSLLRKTELYMQTSYPCSFAFSNNGERERREGGWEEGEREKQRGQGEREWRESVGEGEEERQERERGRWIPNLYGVRADK